MLQGPKETVNGLSCLGSRDGTFGGTAPPYDPPPATAVAISQGRRRADRRRRMRSRLGVLAPIVTLRWDLGPPFPGRPQFYVGRPAAAEGPQGDPRRHVVRTARSLPRSRDLVNAAASAADAPVRPATVACAVPGRCRRWHRNQVGDLGAIPAVRRHPWGQ